MFSNSKKQIMLMRHGEAEDFSFGQNDHSRNLVDIGKKQVTSLALQLLSHKQIPQHILYSDSLRTTQTCEIVKSTLKYAAQSTAHHDLYLGNENSFYNHVFALDESITSVLIIGHNPTLSEVASKLTGKAITLGTSHCAILSKGQNSTWNNITANGLFELTQLIRP